MRSVGGLLFGAGAVVLFARKSGHHGWSDFARLLVVLIPALILYLLGLGLLERTRTDRPRPWQALTAIASLLLWPIVLLQFLALVGVHGSHPLYLACVFALTALLAAVAVGQGRIRYAALLAGLSSLIAWLYVWDEILHHCSADTGRWLLVAAGALILIVAVGLARRKAIGAGELATAGGIAAVAAGVLGVIVGGLISALQPFLLPSTTIIEGSGKPSAAFRLTPNPPIGSGGMPQALRIRHILQGRSTFPGRQQSSPFHSFMHSAHTSGLQQFGWDVYLLVLSVALLWVAARWRIRGLGYVGGIGLVAFIISVAAQITRLESGHTPTASIAGWPLLLIFLGIVGLVAPALLNRRSAPR